LLRPLSFLVCAGVLLALSVAVWGQEGMSRPRARGAIQTARECYNRGDYAAAQLLLDQIQVSEGTLAQDEMGELADLKRRNQLALEERRNGATQLMQAEEALAKGRTDEAGALVKSLNVNRYLSAPDKERVGQLAEKLRSSAPGNANPGVKEDARTLTAKARGALKAGDLDHAEQYARQADKIGSSWPAWLQLPWSDSPARVLRDVQAARKEQADAANRQRTGEKQESSSPLTAPLRAVGSLFSRSPAPKEKEQPAPANPSADAARPDSRPGPDGSAVTVAGAVTGGPNDRVTQSTQYRPTPDATPSAAKAQAIDLVGKGFEALRKNDLATAQKCAEQARSLHARFEWWEDSPDKLMAEISRRTAAAQAPPGRDGAPPPANREPSARVQTAPEPPSRPTAPEPTDPRAMVREGFARLREGRFDEADRLSLMAAAAQGTRWGLFEDNPDTLRVAVQKARAQKDREESVRALAEARRLYDRGDYKQAKTLAYRARQLHGPYSMWDRGDRPDRLLAEIQTAEARAIREGGQPSPYRNQTAVVQQKPPGPPEPTAAAREAKQRALALVAEARSLQRQGKLIEARQKVLEARSWAMEAEKGGESYARTDDTPIRAEADLAMLCEGQIQVLLRRAEDCVSTSSPSDATAFQRAEASLNEARQLATVFKLDAGRIDAKTVWLREAQARTQGQPPQVAQKQMPLPGIPVPPAFPEMPTPAARELTGPPAPGVAAASGPSSPSPQELRRQGLEMLEKARLELTSEKLDAARRLAEHVFAGPYGLKDEARGFINSIDAEERNQKYMAANRKFDEAHDAFVRRDYNLARTVLAGLDETLLDAPRLARLREISAVREMQAGGQPVPPSGRELQPVGAADAPGRASASDMGPRPGAPPADDLGYAERYQAMSKILFDKLRVESLDEQNRAIASAKAGNYDVAIDTLRAFIVHLDGSNLSSDQLALLRRPLERRMDDYRKLKLQKEWEDKQAANLPNADARERQRVFDIQKRQDELGNMMKQYATLVREGKLDDALVLAYKMKDIDPDSPAVQAAITMGQIRRNLRNFNAIADERKDYFVDSLNDAERSGKYPTMHNPIDFDREITDRARKRQDLGNGILSDRRGERERHIEQKLGTRISLNFKDTPLSQIIDDLHQMTGVNVVADTTALEEAGVALSQLLSLKVEDMSLKSALNILLKQARLTYVIKDEALQITTEEHAKGKLKMVTYPVADLVVPVENHTLPVVADFNKLADNLWKGATGGGFNYGGPMPYVGPGAMPGAPAVSDPVSGRGYAWNPPGAQAPPLGGPNKPIPGTTIEDMLIRLITQTVEPSTWTEVGGKGTIQYFPLGLALVINQTQDIQEQIQDLLAALRRLQDLEVAIEMRLVSVSEAFFEMMRLDFDLNITNRQTRYEPQLITQQFAPPGYINAFRPNGFFSGLTPAGTFTPDLGVPINNSSFDFALPPFGGYPGTFGADGGLTLGLAFLSDIQVFMLLEAAQGDRRYNVMQAPKITVFNGQTATINVNDGQFFLTQVNVVPFGSQLVFQPVNAPVLFGVFLQVTPVVSADRRFVRLNMNPTLTNLFSATTPLVPVQIPVNDLFLDNVQSVQPRIFQTFFQQPSLSQITVATTVVIPDGGTVLLGGIKTLSEGRNEFGPPVLSKIPYVNRLFKNVGYGRETQSLMILVTARIIINEEEEQIFLGNLPPIPR
jgi:type II secretory pathway component GspD/PulD (secretin)